MFAKSTILKKTGILPAVLILLAVGMAGCGSTDSGEDPGELFDSGVISSGGIFMNTFDQEGTFEYFCSIHSPDMQGEITVDPSAQTTAQDTVEMVNEQFVPSQLTVAPNTEVVWINRDGFSHTVTSGNPDTGGNTGGGGY